MSEVIMLMKVYVIPQAVPKLKRLIAGFPPRRPGFASKGDHVAFVMGGRFSPSTSDSPANHHPTNFSIIILTRSWHNRLIGGLVPSGPNWTPPPTIPI
jgi:hypothetical protein